MPAPAELRTARLVLRRWREEDLAPFARLNGDPETMAYFPAPLTRAESDALVARLERSFEDTGLGMWAVTGHDGTFVGAVGLLAVGTWLPFGPTVETGWRLHRDHWGKGYATEAAGAALRWGFTEAEIGEIVAFTAAVNERSRAVMARLGMRHDEAGDFLHPRIPEDHRLQPHVLYRLPAAEWEGAP